MLGLKKCSVVENEEIFSTLSYLDLLVTFPKTENIQTWVQRNLLNRCIAKLVSPMHELPTGSCWPYRQKPR